MGVERTPHPIRIAVPAVALHTLHPMRTREFVFVAAIATAASAPAVATTLASHPVVVAVHHGDCIGAVKLVNPEVSANDEQTAFLAGRMLDEGLCVKKDPVAAAHFFARAADLGDKPATIEYGAKIGLGEGAEQSYERAGIVCRTGGLDPQSKLPTYSLGYACTVGALAGEKLRESLPKGAFRPNAGTLVVAFSPASGSMTIKSTPVVGVSDVSTGSNLRSPLINAPQEINKAWRDALAAAPKPDPAHLDDETVVLPIDVDMTLEPGREVLNRIDSRNFGTLMQGDVRPGPP
jgi:hypothetical protein